MNIAAPIVFLVLAAILQIYSVLWTPIFIFIIAIIYIVAVGVFGIIACVQKRPSFIFIFMIASIVSEVFALTGFGFLIAITVDLRYWKCSYFGICGAYGLFIFLTILSAVSIPLYGLMIYFMYKLRKAILAQPQPAPLPMAPMGGAQPGLVYVQGPNGQLIPTYLNTSAPPQAIQSTQPGTVFINPQQQMAFLPQPIQQSQVVLTPPVTQPQPAAPPQPATVLDETMYNPYNPEEKY